MSERDSPMDETMEPMEPMEFEIGEAGELDATERNLLLRLGGKMGRRGFLGKLALGSVGFLGVLMGISRKAEALVNVACCTLCKSSTGCSGVCCWQWACCNSSSGFRAYFCKECYNTQSACTGGCTGVKCSQAVRTQILC